MPLPLQAQILGYVVCKNMGEKGTDEELYDLWKECNLHYRERKRSLAVPITRLKVGLARHRAVMFKYLADCLQITAKIERQKYVVVKMDNGQEWCVDLMSSPGKMTIVTPYRVPWGREDSLGEIDHLIDARVGAGREGEVHADMSQVSYVSHISHSSHVINPLVARHHDGSG